MKNDLLADIEKKARKILSESDIDTKKSLRRSAKLLSHKFRLDYQTSKKLLKLIMKKRKRRTKNK